MSGQSRPHRRERRSEWGTNWLEAKGLFDERLDPALKDRVQALQQKHFPDKDMSWTLPGPGQEGKVNTCRK